MARMNMIAYAQGNGGVPKTSNPTPGTPQPDPPKLEDRITLTGCLEPSKTAGRAAKVDPAAKSDDRWVLTSAERQALVPADTGTSATAASVKSNTFRLDGIESQIGPFSGTKVQVSGEVEPAAAPQLPLLHVGFIQKLAASCR
jgi:hypothetical protein